MDAEPIALSCGGAACSTCSHERTDKVKHEQHYCRTLEKTTWQWSFSCPAGNRVCGIGTTIGVVHSKEPRRF